MHYARGGLAVYARDPLLWHRKTMVPPPPPPPNIFRAGLEGVGSEKGCRRGGGTSLDLLSLSNRESRFSGVHHSPHRGRPKGKEPETLSNKPRKKTKKTKASVGRVPKKVKLLASAMPAIGTAKVYFELHFG